MRAKGLFTPTKFKSESLFDVLVSLKTWQIKVCSQYMILEANFSFDVLLSFKKERYCYSAVKFAIMITFPQCKYSSGIFIS